jgi:hypothetical protein
VLFCHGGETNGPTAENNKWFIHLLMHSPCVPVTREEVIVACTANTWVYMRLCTSYCSKHSAWCEEHHMSHFHPHCMMFLGVIIIMFDFVAYVHSLWPPSQFNQYLYSSLKHKLYLFLQLHIRYLHVCAILVNIILGPQWQATKPGILSTVHCDINL